MLPENTRGALAPLLEILPLEAAMPELVVARSAAPRGAREAVAALVASGPVAAAPALCAGLWLYVDELDRSHTISQGIDDATGSFWHGIMHRREGDFGNAHYWFRQAGAHPAMRAVAGYDGHAFVDAVAAAQPGNPGDLVGRQRGEWAALFAWCAAEAGLA